ncbi:hypothetical protein [Caulobacter sp. NIBR2454]|uniref:hypothetical protein n=1 Tax=Caulobacter sp. NIBR2454 TaxID=3015996 RepID=UPI0022B6F9B3|nr:hypothetical protein [Caulobacter sp. NIBR2454]
MNADELAVATLRLAERQALAAEAQVFWSAVGSILTAVAVLFPVMIGLWQAFGHRLFPHRAFGSTYTFVGGGGELDSTITLFNRLNVPLTIIWWDIVWLEFKWWKITHEAIVVAPDVPWEEPGFTLSPHGSHTFTVGTEHDPFEWGREPTGRALYLRFYIVGDRRPIRLKVYPKSLQE